MYVTFQDVEEHKAKGSELDTAIDGLSNRVVRISSTVMLHQTPYLEPKPMRQRMPSGMTSSTLI